MKQAIGSFDELVLPKGEHVLWQGRPRARSMAVRVFHVRPVLAWFVLLFAGGVAMRAAERQPWIDAVSGASRPPSGVQEGQKSRSHWRILQGHRASPVRSRPRTA